jgi:hypothetical protein
MSMRRKITTPPSLMKKRIMLVATYVVWTSSGFLLLGEGSVDFGFRGRRKMLPKLVIDWILCNQFDRIFYRD